MKYSNREMKRKIKQTKKKIRIPLPKQREKIKESEKIYKRKRDKRITDSGNNSSA